MPTTIQNTSGVNPKGNKLLVRLKDVEAISKGGIVIPVVTQDREHMAQTEGYVISVGPMCWVDEPEKRCKEGDYIIFARYSGEFFTGNDGIQYRIINARDVVATKDVPGTMQAAPAKEGTNG